MYRYVLKVASLDENLIVKQKARFLSHVLEYREEMDLKKFTAPETVKNVAPQPARSDETNDKVNLLSLSYPEMEQANANQMQEAEQARRLGYQEVDGEMIDSASMVHAVELSQISSNQSGANVQSVSSDAFRSHNEAMAHSQQQDYNRSRFS